MRAFIFAAGAALTLAACGGTTEANEANSTDLQVNNLVVDDSVPIGMDNMDANLDANTALDAATANAIAEDLTTNTPDANLANGM